MRAFLTLIISLWSLTSNRGAALMHADRWHQSCPSTNHRSISVELASVPLLWDQCWGVHSFPLFGRHWLLSWHSCPVGEGGRLSWAPNPFSFFSSVRESYPSRWHHFLGFLINCIILSLCLDLCKPPTTRQPLTGLLCVVPGKFLSEEVVAAPSKVCPLVRRST